MHQTRVSIIWFAFIGRIGKQRMVCYFKVKMISMVEEVELGWLKIKTLDSFTPFHHHSRYGEYFFR